MMERRRASQREEAIEKKEYLSSVHSTSQTDERNSCSVENFLLLN